MERLDGVASDGLELQYAVFPAFDRDAEIVGDGFRASAIAVDVVFADGSRLLDDPVRDQYGLPGDAASSYARHTLPPDQWALRRIELPPGLLAVALEVVVDAPAPAGRTGEFLHAWIDGAALAPRRPLDRALPPSEIADTRRGSHSSPTLSRGLTVPLVGVPHGSLFVHPVTDAAHPHWNYAWNRHGGGRRPALEALSISHTASIWIGDWGVLQFMPRPESAGSGSSEPFTRAAPFGHESEEAHPGRYRVELDSGIVAEATATDHVAVLRFSFAAPGGSIVLDRLDDGDLTFTPDAAGGVLSGWVDGSTVHGQVVPRMFVDARVDGPVVELLPSQPRHGRASVLRIESSTPAVVEVRVGTSFISYDLARRAREVESVEEFGTISAAAQSRWDARLGLVEVEGASDDQLRTLYSNLSRLFAYPNMLSESDAGGREVHADVARLDRVEHAADRTGSTIHPGPLTANHGFWDTYRTAWPALMLLTPGSARKLVEGVVAQYRDGGWLPRWAAPGPLDAMVGTSGNIVLADALAHGLLDGDLLADGYSAALRDASSRPPHPAVGRKGMPAAIYRGYVADDVAEGLSWGVEGALNDFGLYRMATHLAAADPAGERGDRHAESRWFASRALAATRYFDPGTGFLRGLDPAGNRRTGFDPRRWGGDYTETNAWGMAFSIPHDGAGLATLHGGRDQLRARLDAFFREAETGRAEFRGTYPDVIHEMIEARDVRLGMWGLSNQPAHHIPYMYAHAGYPAGTQRIVREALARLFTGSEIGQGYPGDEDNGEMSAWWLFGALGLYPLVPGSGEWAIGSPLLPLMRWRLPGGDLVVIAHGWHPEHPYVQQVLVDGEPWTRTVIPHSRLVGGASIEVFLGPEPSEWGTGPGDAPSSLSTELRSRGWGALRDALVSATGTDDVSCLVDDTGQTVVSLAAGASVELKLSGTHTVELVTLGFVDAGAASWRIDAFVDGSWVTIDERRDTEVRWPWQTRPFLPMVTVTTDQLRLVAQTPLRLAQVEALVAERRPGPRPAARETRAQSSTPWTASSTRSQRGSRRPGAG
jgi:predicted alpha-1,2-mannosidase